ncbi:MAG: protein kinase [Burkholderiales bacterium]
MFPNPLDIGKYKIERELGRGASGVVYLAHDTFRDNWVAIKQIHPHLMLDQTQAIKYRRLLYNEAVLVGQINHPHIVSLIDVNERANPPYLVLEYVQGQSLEQHSTPDTLLPVSEVLGIAFKCCNALEYAHLHGLVHRDIKPANLLLRNDGEVKLTDFGAAMSQNGDVTQLAGLMGSPAYMSPEQIREEKLTQHSDMFSLGVVLYELLTGQKPFQGDSDYATIYKIGAEEPVSIRVLRPELPSALDELVRTAIAKKPQDRFANWATFSDAIFGASSSIKKLTNQITELEQFQKLRQLDFFRDFGDVAIWETLRLGRIRSLDLGTVLMKEGTNGHSFYLLLEGTVRVTNRGLALTKLKAGVSIGEMAYLQPGENVRSATVTAESNISVLKIKSMSLQQASVELQSCFDKAFIKMLVTRLIATNQQLSEWNL